MVGAVLVLVLLVALPFPFSFPFPFPFAGLGLLLLPGWLVGARLDFSLFFSTVLVLVMALLLALALTLLVSNFFHAFGGCFRTADAGAADVGFSDDVFVSVLHYKMTIRMMKVKFVTVVTDIL